MEITESLITLVWARVHLVIAKKITELQANPTSETIAASGMLLQIQDEIRKECDDLSKLL